MVSVGNLSVGGTGKTPMVLYLVEYFVKKYPQKKIIVLSRGYKAQLSRQGALLPLNPDPKLYGDEPSLIKSKFPGIFVVIGVNRYQSFRKFIPSEVQNSKETIVILDDGFQHIQIQRDFDIVLLDSNAPLGNGFTIPLGILREPATHLTRADIIIFTKMNDSNRKKVEAVKSKLFPLNQTIFDSKISFQKIPVEPNRPYVLVTGVGNPKDVLYTAKQVLNSERIQLRTFPDHHDFSEKDLDSLLGDKLDNNYETFSLVTTEKDWIKIAKFPKFLQSLKEKGLSFYVIQIGVQLEEESEFLSIIDRLVSTSEAKTDP